MARNALTVTDYGNYINTFETMIELQPKINKTDTVRELKVEANLRYYNAYEKERATECYMQGVKDTIKKLTLR